MALSNFTVPFGGLGMMQGWGATAPPIHQYTAVNNLAYGPQTDNPAPHQQYYKNNPYSAHRSSQSQFHETNTRRTVGNTYLPPPIPSSQPAPPPPSPSSQRTYGETNYVQHQQQPSYFNGYNSQTRILSPLPNLKFPQQSPRSGSPPKQPQPTQNTNDPFPERPPGFTHVQAGQGSRTQVHAVLDYDADEGDYDDQEDQGESN